MTDSVSEADDTLGENDVLHDTHQVSCSDHHSGCNWQLL